LRPLDKKALPDARPHTPLFMVLAGKFVERPSDGSEVDKRWTNEVLEYWVSGVRKEKLWARSPKLLTPDPLIQDPERLNRFYQKGGKR